MPSLRAPSMMRACLCACAFLLVLQSRPTLANAQVVAAASISGRVSDPSGAVVPGVKVTATQTATGISTTTVTDSSGFYSFSLLNPGPVSITFTAPGFAAKTANAVLVLNQAVTVNATINVGMQAETIAVTTVPNGGNSSPGAYVIVTTNAVAGPMGYAATPTITGATQSLSAQQQAFIASQQFNFPSIILYVSAAPLVTLTAPSGDPDKIPSAQETDRNPLWLDASFTLSAFDANGYLPNACTDGSIQVLGLLPQQTVSALKNQTAADVASGVNDVAGALASFYPGVQDQVSAATKAMNIVFQDIFPPQPVAYEYSNLTDSCNFGWYFRPNLSPTTGSSGPASILGIQTGIVLLKTSKNIVKLTVNGRTISAWNKPPTASTKKIYVGADKTIGTILLPDASHLDYDNLGGLTMFPALIPQAQAMSILHIKQPADFLTFAKANSLVGTDANYDYVTNVSLAAFLTLSTPKPAVASQPAAPAPATPAAPTAPAKTTPAKTAPAKAAGGHATTSPTH